LNPDNWKTWLESFTEKNVVVSLPRFRFDFEEKLNEELKDMGMRAAFSLFEAVS